MSDNSHIEWTDSTWNPVTGCTKISAGCKHCYAERFAERFRGVKGNAYEQGFDLKLWPERLEVPLRWRKPRKVFVNSMSDLFHERVPTFFIKKVFGVMNKANWHIFQVLTKRPERALKLASEFVWSSNIWMGTTIENVAVISRAEVLRKIPAKVRFCSLEPLLSSMKGINFSGINWIIVGGESGPGARPMHEEWVKEIHNECVKANIPFFFKQWGGVNKKKRGRLLNGRIWDEEPVVLAQGIPKMLLMPNTN